MFRSRRPAVPRSYRSLFTLSLALAACGAPSLESGGGAPSVLVFVWDGVDVDGREAIDEALERDGEGMSVVTATAGTLGLVGGVDLLVIPDGMPELVLADAAGLAQLRRLVACAESTLVVGDGGRQIVRAAVAVPDGGGAEGGEVDGGLPDGGLPDGGLPDGGEGTGDAWPGEPDGSVVDVTAEGFATALAGIRARWFGGEGVAVEGLGPRAAVEAYERACVAATSEPRRLHDAVDAYATALQAGLLMPSIVHVDPRLRALLEDPETRADVRRLATENAREAVVRLAPGDTADRLLRVRGRVVDVDGRPLGRALVRFYHADPNGRYSPEATGDGEGERNPIRFACVRTDEFGCFRVTTTLPGGYGNAPPHFHVGMLARTGDGEDVRGGGSLYFEGDWPMDDEVYDDAGTGHAWVAPVGALSAEPGAVLHADVRLVLRQR